MSHSAEKIIRSEFESSLVDLVAHYAGGNPVATLDTRRDESYTTAAIVGLGNKDFRCSTILLGNEDVANRLSNHDVKCPIDWLGELSNQLAGRWKNKMSRYGVSPQMGAPVTVTGEGISLGVVGILPVIWTVAWDNGSAQAILTMELSDSFELTKSDADVAEEGSMSLF